MIADFFVQSEEKEDYGKRISEAAIARIQSRYTWERYASRMMTLSRVCGFWKYVTNLERDEPRRYLQKLLRTAIPALGEYAAGAVIKGEIKSNHLAVGVTVPVTIGSQNPYRSRAPAWK